MSMFFITTVVLLEVIIYSACVKVQNLKPRTLPLGRGKMPN